jgi:hypothetical protein
MSGDQAYGLWILVVLNTGLFVLFAASFFHPRSGRDWRAMGAFIPRPRPARRDDTEPPGGAARAGRQRVRPGSEA